VVASPARLAGGSDHLCDNSPAVETTSARAPLRRGPRPRLPTGGGNEAIKAKELEARRQVVLAVSPVEATTSAAGNLTSGGDHLRTGGLPATAAAPATHVEVLAPALLQSEDKTIQERGRHLRGVRRLVRPPGMASEQCAMDATNLRTTRPSPVRWTNNRTPLGGGRRHWKRRQSHPGQGARHAAADGARSRPAPRSRSSPPPQGW
jgi:hypothetical protein